MLLNAVDDPAHCHFAVPAVLRRGDLTVTVSTGGRAPGYARPAPRTSSAKSVGAEYGALVDLIGDVRAELRAQRDARLPERSRLRRVGRRAGATPCEHDLIGLVQAGRTGEARALLRAALADDDDKEAVA